MIKILKQLYKCFQHWSDGGSVYIYSDPHFDDSDCKTIDLEWPTPAEQVEKINNKVKKSDTLIILGDIGNPEWVKKLKAGYKVLIAGNHDAGLSNYEKTTIEETKSVMSKFEIWNNEDDYNRKVKKEERAFYQKLSRLYPDSKIEIHETFDFHAPFHYFKATIKSNLFDEVYGGPLFISDKILLSHEPIDLPFGLNIHGHCHNIKGLYNGGNKFNVCSNTIGYEPISLGEIIKYGYLKRVDDIHRITIDKATANPIHKVK